MFFYFRLISLLTLAFWHIPDQPKPKQANFHTSKAKKLAHVFPKNIQAEKWADSILQRLSTKEKVAQMMMIRAHSNLDEKHCKEVEDLVRTHKVGGLCFFQGSPTKQAELTNRYQKAAKIPLWVSIDGEWGLKMRLDSTVLFPRQMALGAIQNDSLLYRMGVEVARQCLRIGTHINFAPVVDVNNNADNPVIGDRSFGENMHNVAKKATAYMQGMQAGGLITTAKHFPGHGDTNLDSHYTLPVIAHNETRMRSLEMYPFAQLIQKGVTGVMVAHLKIPSLDDKITTLSEKIIKGWLRDSLGFQGLVFTDALEMKGVALSAPPTDVALEAYKAGNDVLLLPYNVPACIDYITQYVEKTPNLILDLNKRVKRILEAKYTLGLAKYKPVSLKNLTADLHLSKTYALQQQLYKEALTIVRNQQKTLPIVRTDSILTISLGATDKTIFQKTLDSYARCTHIQASYQADFDKIMPFVPAHKVVVVSLHEITKKKQDLFGISSKAQEFLRRVAIHAPLVVVNTGTPYSLHCIDDLPTVVCTYEDNWVTQKLVAQLLMGAITANGKLPVTPNYLFPRETGETILPTARLRFGVPEEVGMHSDTLKRLDAMIENAIQQRFMPGGQLVVVRKGAVLINKGYGTLDYDKKKPVTAETIYDVASITKVASTLQAVMCLYEAGKLDLNTTIQEYLPALSGTPQGKMVLRDVLTHQAGLIPYIRHYDRTISETCLPKPHYYQTVASETHPLPVAQGMFGNKVLRDLLWDWSLEPPLTEKGKYEYSDVGFYVLRQIVEKITGESIDKWVERNVYLPLGLNNTLFNPTKRFPLSQIAPTERDTYFRHQLIHGFVHDQGAAMAGGVAGHAGLFSTAYDLAVIMQMQIQKGRYGRKQFLQPETVELFTTQQFPTNRRGLGWDKPDSTKRLNYIPDLSSQRSFGHSGFTGCVVWADPETEIVIVFLSNRIFPTVDNTGGMIGAHFRRKLLNTVFRAVK
ncbi:MAG: hypothetical protein EAZ95_06470 [Bacteroidetes bacterium]|nr:MAG: hypothetical protein EAZ95_06470 [Bacteroidota bacterium]